MKFGFLSDIGEITPSIFAKLDKLSRAKIFIALYNVGVESELKIPLSYAKFLNFKDIFEARINFLLRDKFLNFKPVDSFCIPSNIVINAYLRNDFKALKFVAKEPKIGSSCFRTSSTGLSLAISFERPTPLTVKSSTKLGRSIELSSFR